MEEKTGQKRQSVLLPLMLFWLGQPLCLALINTNCKQINRLLKTYVNQFWMFCNPPDISGLVVSCHGVTTLPEDIHAIPRDVCALCLMGELKELKAQIFQAFPELRYLRLEISHTGVVISPMAFGGLGKLEHLLILHTHFNCFNTTIPRAGLLPVTSLQKLTLMNIRLTGQRGIMFPAQVKSLLISRCCLKEISELLSVFPMLSLVAQVSLDFCKMEGNISSEWKHPNLSTRVASASQFQKQRISRDAQRRSPYQSLSLSHFRLAFTELLGLDIEKLDFLSLVRTDPMHHNNGIYRVCVLATHFSLQSLTFSQNHYKSFDSDDLPGCYSVKYLVLSGNNMEQVDSWLLYKLPHLHLLDLSENRLQWNLCPGEPARANFTSKLRILDFSGNRFNLLQSNPFSCLPYMEKLSLSNCRLHGIHPSIFSGLGQLVVLNLRNNNITHLDHHLFFNLSRLAALDLTGNPIEKLQNFFFHDLNVLRELHFGSQRVGVDVNFLPPSLEMLSIESSKIGFHGESSIIPAVKKLTLDTKQLEVDSCKLPLFSHVKELQLKNLVRATFSCNASVSFFHQFPLLEKLDYHCHLQSFYWKGLNFSHLPNLKILKAYNLEAALKDISTDESQYLFQNLTQLEVLCLGKSGIKYISTVLFRDMKSLQLLVLYDTLIFKLDSGFGDEMKQLKYFYLDNISFGCYCTNAWFITWASRKKDLQVSNISPLKCQHLTTVKKTLNFLPFVEQNCILRIDFFLFVVTSLVTLLLLFFPLVHATCSPEIFFLIYTLRGWWHKLCGARGKGRHFKYDAFVSYCMQDQDWVLQYLVPNLEQRGPPFLKLCLQSRDFVAGKAIVDNIMDYLYSSRKAICVISRHALHNHWCSLEMSLATYRVLTEQQDTLIVVFLEHISKYQLSAYHRLAKLVKRKTYLDWPEEPAAQSVFWDRLRKSISKSDSVEEEKI